MHEGGGEIKDEKKQENLIKQASYLRYYLRQMKKRNIIECYNIRLLIPIRAALVQASRTRNMKHGSIEEF